MDGMMDGCFKTFPFLNAAKTKQKNKNIVNTTSKPQKIRPLFNPESRKECRSPHYYGVPHWDDEAFCCFLWPLMSISVALKRPRDLLICSINYFVLVRLFVLIRHFGFAFPRKDEMKQLLLWRV
jgi:hypothetical protein